MLDVLSIFAFGGFDGFGRDSRLSSGGQELIAAHAAEARLLRREPKDGLRLLVVELLLLVLHRQ